MADGSVGDGAKADARVTRNGTIPACKTGPYLKELREKLGWPVEQAAFVARYRPQTILEWEQEGEAEYLRVSLYAETLCAHLGIDMIPIPRVKGEIRPKNSITESFTRGMSERVFALGVNYPELKSAGAEKPKTYGQCLEADLGSVEMPCPFVSCKHHLFVNVEANGSLLYTQPGIPVEQSGETCSLRFADRGGTNLEEVADALHITRERVRQIEAEALTKLLRGFKKAGYDDVVEIASLLKNVHRKSSEKAAPEKPESE